MRRGYLVRQRRFSMRKTLTAACHASADMQAIETRPDGSVILASPLFHPTYCKPQKVGTQSRLGTTASSSGSPMTHSISTHLAALIDMERTLAEVRERIESFDTFDRLSESIETLVWTAHINLRRSEDPSLPIAAAEVLFDKAVTALDEAAATIERLKQELKRADSPATEAVQ